MFWSLINHDANENNLNKNSPPKSLPISITCFNMADWRLAERPGLAQPIGDYTPNPSFLEKKNK